MPVLKPLLSVLEFINLACFPGLRAECAVLAAAARR